MRRRRCRFQKSWKPSRLVFIPGSWKATEEGVGALDNWLAEGDGSEADLGFDGGAAALAEFSKLKDELSVAREREQDLRRRRERFYGRIYFYEFAPETELFWRIDDSQGTDWLLARDTSREDDQFARALIPPDESTAWRWTAASSPDDGGEYLAPAEALAKAPREFSGWVVAKTYEALQRTRFALFDLAKRSLTDTDDLVRVKRLATHAQSLSGLSQRSVAYPGQTRSTRRTSSLQPSGRTAGRFCCFPDSGATSLKGTPR